MTFDTRALAKLTIEAYVDAECTERAGRWEALFNPTELAYSRSNDYEWQLSAGASKPQLQYKGGEPDEISLELFFDGTGVVDSDDSVRDRIEQFLELTSYHGDAHQPYYLHLWWGSFNFRGVRTGADVKYTLFDRAAEPLRATLSIGLREALPPEEVTSEEANTSPDLYQTWQVAQGETLDHIAHTVYGDPAYWRQLAEANGLVNPLDLEPGAVLVLPPKEV
jgi:nucleoid-associated protein YgaU